jgi:hypothetical protein
MLLHPEPVWNAGLLTCRSACLYMIDDLGIEQATGDQGFLSVHGPTQAFVVDV